MYLSHMFASKKSKQTFSNYSNSNKQNKEREREKKKLKSLYSSMCWMNTVLETTRLHWQKHKFYLAEHIRCWSSAALIDKFICVIMWLQCFNEFVQVNQSHIITQKNYLIKEVVDQVLQCKITTFVKGVW